MYTRGLFPKFNQAVLFQKRAQASNPANEDEDEAFHYAAEASHKQALHTARDGGLSAATSSATPMGSLVLFLSVASAFMMLALLATTYYYYHRKRANSASLLKSSHKVLLLSKKDSCIPLQERSFLISSYNGGHTSPQGTAPPAKTRAVRSPSSGQVNPFAKKSPSPTGPIPKEGFGHDESSKSNEINNNAESLHQHPAGQLLSGKLCKNGKMLSSIESLDGVSGKESRQDSAISACKKNSIDVAVAPNLGRLSFTLKYSYEKRALSVVVNSASDLAAPKSGGTLDPYVKMQLLPEKQHKAKTRVLRKTHSPVYNEEFTFLGVTPNLLESLVVHFVVLNSDRFARDEILGEVVCKLNQFEFDSLEKQISLVRDIAPRGNKLKVQELGELLVSLCYQPIANRLTVVILKARNLPKMDLTGLCDPYVKIYVFHNNQRIFKKRTHVKKRTLSPVFNESFVFDIPPEEGLDNIQMQLLVYDHDRVTRNELIGKIDISCSTGCPTTEKHWNEVIKSPRRQIAEWHKLKEC